MSIKFNILSNTGKSKGLKIFKSDVYEHHERAPMAQLFWKIRWAIGIWCACAFAFAIAFIIEHLWRYGFSHAGWVWSGIYLKHMFFTGGISVIAELPSFVWRIIMHTDLACIAPILPLIAYFFLADSTLVDEFNPHGKDKFDKESATKAIESDIKEMKLFNGFMMVLGYFKKKPLMMNQTLSALCVAPPGTGKTEGIVLPTIFETNGASMIINDVKPELDGYSSGFRAKVGPVFIMNWAGQDDPNRGIYYPSWNPLSPEHVPFNQEKRDLYVDMICSVLIPENRTDPHWSTTGRAALSGMIQYIISKVERAKADDYFHYRITSGTFNEEDAAVLADYYMTMVSDPNAYAALALLQKGELNEVNYVHVGTWENIPDSWRGKEASLPLILDWLNASQLKMAAEMEERRRQGDQMVMMADPMHDIFEGAVNEARHYAYAHRAVLELTQVANTPDKERGSILSTVMAGLGIFRNAAVRNRTSHSDFHFTDLRGMVDPNDGKIKPVTIYLSINMVDAEALNPITAIFIELMSSFLLANGPEEIGDTGIKMGPYPVLFVLDEFPKMQKLQAVIQGPDLGRSKKISYLFIGQDLHQIQEKYGADATSTIMSTTAAKIILRQNDIDGAKKFSELIGDKIEKKKKKGPDGKEIEDTERKPLFSPYDIMKLDAKHEIVLFQGFYNRPIYADLQMAWQDPVMSKLKTLPKASPIPEFLIPAHCASMGYTGPIRFYDNVTKELKILAQ